MLFREFPPFKENSMTYPDIERLSVPVSLTDLPLPEQIRHSFSSMILSASGWRKVFAADGDQHSTSQHISDADLVILITAARVFSKFMREHFPEASTLLTAADTRPTGIPAAQVMIRTLLNEGWDIRYLGSAAVPEVIAHNMMSHEIHGGIYISASHNPLGHNGIKFFASAGVIGGSMSAQLIAAMEAAVTDPEASAAAAAVLTENTFKKFLRVLDRMDKEKLLSEESYRQFSGLTISGSSCLCGQDDLYGLMRESLQRSPLTLMIDFNGSARTTSIDISLFQSLGISVKTIHDTPGRTAHGIIPEGENLEPCRKALEEAYAADPSCILGYMPDNDGDRGNIVYIEESTGTAKIMEAQEVFSLVFMAESAYMRYLGHGPESPLAAAVNCPTSMRIEEIADAFGIDVFRGEVGEANVVNLAENLRAQGYTVRVLGEGSNGGCIIHPSVVRDPLNTLFSIIKLLTIPDAPAKPGLYRIWHTLSGSKHPVHELPSLEQILNSLPSYRTTAASDSRALMQVDCPDQEAFKQRWEKCFLDSWEQRKDELRRRYDITSWREFNTEGTESREGMGSKFRTGRSSGGLRIVLYDQNGTPSGFIWMRKSGTEPVFRILADARGDDPDKEAYLLDWHREIIENTAQHQ